MAGCALPAGNRAAPTLLPDDPCLYWLADVRRAVEARQQAADSAPGRPATPLRSLPEICPYYEDLAILAALLDQPAADRETAATRGLLDRLGRASLRQLAESLITATTAAALPPEKYRQQLARLVAQRGWQSAEALQAIELLQQQPHSILEQRLLVDVPHLAPAIEWERTLDAHTYSRLLAGLSHTQGMARMANLAEARLTRRMDASLDAGLFRERLGMQHYWRGRMEFIERHYTQALQHFRLSDRDGGISSRERALWSGRTLARLSRPEDAEAALRSVAGPWDHLRCDAWFRIGLIQGYARDYRAQRQTLETATAHCTDAGYSSTDISWELWKNELATQDNAAAMRTIQRYGELFVSAGLLRTTERSFWLCYLRRASSACATDPNLASDPFLPYREALAPGSMPALIIAEEDPAVTLEPLETMLLRDLRLVGWDSLYFNLLEELYRQQPYGALEELYIGALAHQQSVHTAIKRIERELPRERSLRWMHMVLLYPFAYRDHVESAATAHGIERALPWAIMREESRYQPTARSWVGAEGLMQLMPYTAKRLDVHKLLYNGTLYDPQVNIPLGTQYLGQLMQRYQSPVWAIAAYNAGEEAVDTWRERFRELPLPVAMELIPYTETRNYVKKVLRSLLVYRFRLGEPQPPLPVTGTALTAGTAHPQP